MKHCVHWIFIDWVSTSICRITKSVNFHTKYREAKILGSHCGQDFALLGAQSNTSAYYRDWTTPELCPFLVCGRYPFLGQCPRHLSVLEKICRGVTLSLQQSIVMLISPLPGTGTSFPVRHSSYIVSEIISWKFLVKMFLTIDTSNI